MSGIKLISKPMSGATHHIIDAIQLNPAVVSSLILGASFVTSRWLQEYLRLSQLPLKLPSNNPGGVNPEDTFIKVSENSYQSALPGGLDAPLISSDLWRPKAERKDMFDGLLFMFVSERAALSQDLADMVKIGGGKSEGFIAEKGHDEFEAAIMKHQQKRARASSKLVLVADAESLTAALGAAGWQQFVAVANW